MEDGDRYNLQYRTANDGKVRPEHVAMHGITFHLHTRSGRSNCIFYENTIKKKKIYEPSEACTLTSRHVKRRINLLSQS